MTRNYTEFAESFQSGVEKINAERDKPAPNLGGVATAAFNALGETGFGYTMMNDRDLRDHLDRLESGLVAWTEIMQKDPESDYSEEHPSVSWAFDDAEENVRAYLYWGRLGEVLHHFRDQGRMLSTFWENVSRAAVCDSAKVLSERLEKLLSDLVVKAVYDEGVLKRATTTVNALQRLQVDLQHSPLDISEESPQPFQDGDSIIRRQFLTVINLMAFELFGNVSPTILDRLLELKSSTADGLELRAWPISSGKEILSRTSRITMMRAQIRKDLPLARHKARKHGWRSKAVIDYFAKHSEKREMLLQFAGDDE